MSISLLIYFSYFFFSFLMGCLHFLIQFVVSLSHPSLRFHTRLNFPCVCFSNTGYPLIIFDALVTDSVCNLIPRTPSLVSCPLGTMKDDMAVGTGNGRICRLSCLFSRVMPGR